MPGRRCGLRAGLSAVKPHQQSRAHQQNDAVIVAHGPRPHHFAPSDRLALSAGECPAVSGRVHLVDVNGARSGRAEQQPVLAFLTKIASVDGGEQQHPEHTQQRHHNR